MMDRAYRGSRSDGQMRTILPFAAALAAVSFFQAAAPASAAVRAAPAVTAPQPDHRTISRLVDEAFDHYQLPGLAVGVIEDGRVVAVMASEPVFHGGAWTADTCQKVIRWASSSRSSSVSVRRSWTSYRVSMAGWSAISAMKPSV